jgi:hypothetical protein
MAARRLRLRRRLSDQAILICRGLMSPRATRAPESKKTVSAKDLRCQGTRTNLYCQTIPDRVPVSARPSRRR